MATKKQGSDSPVQISTTLVGDVERVASAKDTDTFHKAVVQTGTANADPDPANAVVLLKTDVVEEFTYPRTSRPSRRLNAAAGTLTTRRLAEENGIKSSQLADWSPAGDEADNARGQRSQPISTAEAI
jgi:hypothetical protein